VPISSSQAGADMLSEDSVCAVVVTFHPGPDLVTNLNLLSRQVEHIVVVDNGSGVEALSLLDSLKDQFRCTILCNGTNLGIAAALNRGCQFAVEHNFAWIVTFDQDSTVTENFIQALLLDAEQVKDLGMISPRYVDRRSNKAIPLPKTPSGRLITTLTSGSLLQTEAYIKAGPFNENLFIDCVDIEYCLRLRSMGRCIAESGNAVLLHSLGKTTFHKMFGRNLPVTNHSPTRRYYMTRNSLYVSCRYPRERSWIRHNSLNTFIDAMKILLFEKQKLAKLRFMIKGIVDCLRGRMGQQVLIS
jgi:rhamnosyltransferase